MTDLTAVSSIEAANADHADGNADGNDILDEFLLAIQDYVPFVRAGVTEKRIKDTARLGRWLDALGDYLERLLNAQPPADGATLRAVPPPAPPSR